NQPTSWRKVRLQLRAACVFLLPPHGRNPEQWLLFTADFIFRYYAPALAGVYFGPKYDQRQDSVGTNIFLKSTNIA
ncbi:MAG: hypothetical protein J6N19_18330, partial [Clostridium sp.]|nr:hypothetical protein [Clostridium sp.]